MYIYIFIGNDSAALSKEAGNMNDEGKKSFSSDVSVTPCSSKEEIWDKYKSTSTVEKLKGVSGENAPGFAPPHG